MKESHKKRQWGEGTGYSTSVIKDKKGGSEDGSLQTTRRKYKEKR